VRQRAVSNLRGNPRLIVPRNANGDQALPRGELSELQLIWLDGAIGNTPWNHQALTKLGETLQQAFGVPVRLERPKSNSPGRRAA
jgi:hypothetical protein